MSRKGTGGSCSINEEGIGESQSQLLEQLLDGIVSK